MHPAVFVESVPQESGATKVTRPLRARWRDMLVTGEHGYPSRSEAMSALTLAMVNSGWTWIEYHQAMTDPDLHKMAEYFYKRGSRSRHRSRSTGDVFVRMERMWDHAVLVAQERPAITDKASARQEISIIRAQFRMQGLSGRTKVTDSLVLEHFHQVAMKRGRICLTLSVRDIESCTGVSRPTASRSISRLVTMGWLTKVSPGERRIADAQEYRLTIPECTSEVECTDETLSSKTTTGRTNSVSSVHCVPVTEDAFLHLGRYSALVYAAVGDQGLRAEDIVLLAGVARRTVFKHLKRLAEMEMVVSVDGVWSRTAKSLEELASDLGVVGKKADKELRIETERKMFVLVSEKTQFLVDQKRHGRRTAIENLWKSRGESIPEGVNVMTGEIEQAA